MKDLPIYLNLGLLWRTILVPEFPMGPTEGFSWNFLAVQLLLNPTSLPLRYRHCCSERLQTNYLHVHLYISLFPREPKVRQLVPGVVWGRRLWNGILKLDHWPAGWQWGRLLVVERVQSLACSSSITVHRKWTGMPWWEVKHWQWAEGKLGLNSSRWTPFMNWTKTMKG